nr:hypothetical protein [Tanacetum cinerariifolium]
MHNNITVAGSRDHPPMLATRRYAQWRSRLLRYIDTRPNGDDLRKCILEVSKHTTVETLQTMSPENKAHYESEKKSIHLILTKIGDEIYSTVDACKTAREMWEAIERLQQVWESEAMAVVRARENVGNFIYHKEKMLLCKQAEQGVHLQAEQSDWLADTDEEIDEQELEAHYSYMEKIQEVPTADSGIDFEPLEQNDQNVVECDDERVTLANLIANLKLDVDENKKIQKQLKKANTSLTQELTECKSILAETSRTLGQSNRIRDSCLFGNQRTVNFAAAREKVGSTIVQKSGIQCFNCKEYGHFAKECRKSKRVKDFAYHKEKMLLCKQAEQGVPLQAEQYDWLADTDEEVDE